MPSSDATAPVSREAGNRWGQTLVAGIFCVAFLTLFQRVIGLFRSLLICDWLPSAELGRWDLAFSFLMAVGPLMVLGVPGAFGRFAEDYRRTNRIGRFVLVTAISCLALFSAAAVVVYALQGWAAQLFLGDATQGAWVMALLPVLATVVVFNYLTALLSSLRLHRQFANVQAIHGISFAAFCVAIVPLFSYQATGVVAAYGLACVTSGTLAVASLRRSLRELKSVPAEETTEAEPLGREVLSVLRNVLPMAISIWLATFIANAFRISDRALIVNFVSDEQVALFFVGQYHAARIFPRLLSQFAMTLAAVITPHLAEDWDDGRREKATQRLSSLLKFISLSFCLASAAILVLAPMLLSLKGGKFEVALGWLPWCLASGVTFSLAFVLQNAFWCSKTARWTTVAFLAGLIVNVAIGVALFPLMGLLGIVVATFIANAITLGVMLWVAPRVGFRFNRSMHWFVALPGSLCAGVPGCAVLLIAVCLGIARPQLFFSGTELAEIKQLFRQKFGR